MSKKLKEATSLLGIKKSTKDAKVKCNVFENVANALNHLENLEKGFIELQVEQYKHQLSHLLLKRIICKLFGKNNGNLKKTITQAYQILVSNRCK